MTDSQAEVQLVPVDTANWRDVAGVKPHPEQDRFVAATTYYLCLAHYDSLWNPLAIVHEGIVVGHLMWAYDETEGSVWLGGVVVDAAYQRRGIGGMACEAFIDRFTSDKGANLALSYAPDNTVARRLYASFGFVETGELVGDEGVARLRADA